MWTALGGRAQACSGYRTGVGARRPRPAHRGRAALSRKDEGAARQIRQLNEDESFGIGHFASNFYQILTKLRQVLYVSVTQGVRLGDPRQDGDPMDTQESTVEAGRGPLVSRRAVAIGAVVDGAGHHHRGRSPAASASTIPALAATWVAGPRQGQNYMLTLSFTFPAGTSTDITVTRSHGETTGQEAPAPSRRRRQTQTVPRRSERGLLGGSLGRQLGASRGRHVHGGRRAGRRRSRVVIASD